MRKHELSKNNYGYELMIKTGNKYKGIGRDCFLSTIGV